MELATEYLYNIKARFAKVHLSDIGIVVACFMLIYVFRANDVFILRPVWKFDLQLEHGSLTSGASKPTIDDIDSDGYNEILFTDAKLNVTVMHYRYPMHKSKQLIHPDILATKLLEKYERDSSSILINTGFIAPPYTHETLRKQVLVVAIDREIFCFTDSLLMLWHVRADAEANDLVSCSNLKVVSVFITSLQLTSSEHGNGTVFVSCSCSDDKQDIKQSRKRNLVIALNGDNGNVLWRQQLDNSQEKMTEDNTASWQKYTSDIISMLAHLDHTVNRDVMMLAQFDESAEKSRIIHTPHVAAESSNVLVNFDLRHFVGRPHGGQLPHNDHEHIHHPNILAVRTSNGLFLLQVQTGLLLTALRYDARHALADINGEGNLDTVSAESVSVSGVDTTTDYRCMLVARPLQWPSEPLYAAPLCEFPRTFLSLSATLGGAADDPSTADTHHFVSPVVLPSFSHGIMAHFLGHTLAHVRRDHDTFYLNSHGRLTSVGAHGDINWQMVVSATWFKSSRGTAQFPKANNFDYEQLFQSAFQPSLQPFSLQIFAKPTALLAAGWRSVVLVSAVDGHTIAEHDLPCPPTSTPVTGDFNNDGWTDVVIQCPNAFVGFELRKEPNHIKTLVIALFLITVTVLLSVFCKPEDIDDGEVDEKKET